MGVGPDLPAVGQRKSSSVEMQDDEDDAWERAEDLGDVPVINIIAADDNVSTHKPNKSVKTTVEKRREWASKWWENLQEKL